MHSLRLFDLLVFGSYMGLLFGIGVYFVRQQKDLKTYLLADQNVHWLVVAISVLAALFSGISYLGAPAESFFHDLGYLWVVFSFLIATPITTVIFLPFFRRLNLYTAYEYLERRFDWRLRRIASALFILRVTFYLGLAIFAPSLVVMEVTGWPLWVSVVLTGLAATIYTTLGGMKAVIWTDTLQFLVLCGGIVLILVFAQAQLPGGLPSAWSLAAADGKTRFLNFSLDPTVRITVWSGLIGGCATNLVQLVTDQVAVQRYITAKSLADCRRALWFKFWITIPLVATFYLTGTVLYGFYRYYPDQAPAFVNAALVPNLQTGAGQPIQNDRLLPYFVVTQLPSPMPGLLIAAILGATMAVVSAGVNALATAALMDFRSASGRHDKTGSGQLATARALTTIFGVIPTLLALFVMPYMGTLVESIITIFGLFGGPLLGVFSLGVLSRRSNGSGALVGVFLGAAAGVLTAASGPLWDYPISFLWIPFVSATVTWATGLLASWSFAPPADEVVRTMVHPWCQRRCQNGLDTALTQCHPQ